jgi:purine-binding chemotaxis protein CheW
MKKESAQTKQEENVTEPNVHLIVFKLGGEEYGIRIEQVKEVTITPDIARMPRTPDFIKGVANIRGDIIAIMDLEGRFKIAPTEAHNNKQTYTLVIETDSYNMGILVREVPQSLTVAVSKIDKTPGLIQEVNVHENFIDGIAKVGSRLIIVLDIRKILTVEESEILAATTTPVT